MSFIVRTTVRTDPAANPMKAQEARTCSTISSSNNGILSAFDLFAAAIVVFAAAT
jgi:hypothetical protein